MLIQNASWITMEGAASTVVPVFRRTFSCSMPVRSATLEVTCDGVYGPETGRFSVVQPPCSMMFGSFSGNGWRMSAQHSMKTAGFLKWCRA